jgi:hypothetical protein
MKLLCVGGRAAGQWVEVPWQTLSVHGATWRVPIRAPVPFVEVLEFPPAAIVAHDVETYRVVNWRADGFETKMLVAESMNANGALQELVRAYTRSIAISLALDD